MKPSRSDLYDGRASATISQSQVPENERQALEQAQTAEQLKKFDSAIYSYIQALEFNPDNADTLYRIARIHGLRGNSRIAIKAYKEALVIAPNMTVAHSKLGVLAMNERQYQLSTIHLTKAVVLDQLRLNNSQDKMDKLEYITLDQHSPIRAYNALAVANDLTGDHLKARILFRLALKQQPSSPLLATNLGYSMYLSGHYQLAEQYLKQAIKASPKFTRAWTNLGLVYARTGQYNRAITSFERVMSPADALNDLGYFLLLEQKYTHAVELFRRAIDRSPHYFDQANKNLKQALNRASINTNS